MKQILLYIHPFICRPCDVSTDGFKQEDAVRGRRQDGHFPLC